VARNVVATIPIRSVLEFPASDGAGKVFVNVRDNGEIAVWKEIIVDRPNRWQFEEVVCAENNRICDGSQFGDILEQKTPDV
jgi:hypothetical protein